MKYLIRKIISVFTLTVFIVPAFAQKHGQPLIDSMLAQLPKTIEDTSRAKLLNLLSYTYYRINPDSGIKYGNQALSLSLKLNWKIGVSGANNRLALNYGVKDEYTKALQYDSVAVGLDSEIGNTKGMASDYTNVGLAYSNMGNYSKALEYDFRSLKKFEEVDDKNGIAIDLGNIGLVYRNQADYPKALEYYLKALKIYEDGGNKSGAGRNLDNIGNIYRNQGDYPKALEYQMKSLKLATEVSDKYLMASDYSNIGLIYDEKSDEITSLRYDSMSLKIAEEIGNKSLVASNTANMAEIYIKQFNYAKGIDCFLKSIALSKEIKIKRITGYCFLHVGDTYLVMANDSIHRVTNKYFNGNKKAALAEAKKYLDSSVLVLKQIGNLDILKDAYLDQSKVSALLGDAKSALAYYTSYVSVKDSINNTKNNKKINQLSMQYDFDKQQVIAKEEQDKKDARQRIVRDIFIGGFCFALLFAGVFFFQRKRISNERDRSDGLLLNILPSDVAEELKETGSAKAKYYDNVTVMFTDFKGFTLIGEQLSPTQLVDEINHCFSAYDHIIHKYGIEKIKTIGDAYMAVCGLPQQDDKNAEKVVLACKDILKFMEEYKKERTNKNLPYFEVRIGVNSGSVVAGIVGVKKFAYDIWGDTVNVASRMESSGEPGKINISGTTYELVKDKIMCTYRGKIEAKNKGEIDMYFVND